MGADDSCGGWGEFNVSTGVCRCPESYPLLLAFDGGCLASFGTATAVVVYLFLGFSVLVTVVAAIKMAMLGRVHHHRRSQDQIERTLWSSPSATAFQVNLPEAGSGRSAPSMLLPIGVTASWLIAGLLLLAFCVLLLSWGPMSRGEVQTSLLALFAPATQAVVVGFSMYSAWFALYFLSLAAPEKVSKAQRRKFLLDRKSTRL